MMIPSAGSGGGYHQEDLLRRASAHHPRAPGVRGQCHRQTRVARGRRRSRPAAAPEHCRRHCRPTAGSRPGEERRQDPIWLRGVKYTFVTAIEACVDVAQHICATEGWGPPTDNGDAVRLLGGHGVLTTELAISIRKAVGFRNVLVHDYIEVDDSIVVDRLKSLGDLEEFVRQVAAYVTGAQPEP